MCPTFFPCNSTGGNRAAARPRFSVCVWLVCSSKENPSLGNLSFLRPFVPFVTITIIKSFHHIAAIEITKSKVAVAGPLQACVCVCVCVCVAFPKGSAHAVSGPARCCGVTVDLFSSWLHLLEVCPAHKSQGLILLSHSKKKKRKKKKKKKEGCDYDASAELWQLSERPRLHFVILSPFSEGSKTVVFFFSVQRDEHRTFTFKCVFWQEIISAALN